MSYTLEDLVRASHRRQLQQQQQQQQQLQHQAHQPPQRSCRQAPQWWVFPSYAFNPHQGIYTGGYGDEDSDEDDNQPIYPACYASPYTALPVRQQIVAREPVQQQKSQQPELFVQGPIGPTSVDTVLDILAGLSGNVMNFDGKEEQQAKKPEETASQKFEEPGQQSGSEGSKSEENLVEGGVAKSEESSKVKESKVDQASSSTAGLVSVSKLKKSHSTSQHQEPKSKIGISRRNVRDSSLPYSPQANIYESHESYHLVLAIPGASIKTLDIDFHPNTNELIIKGEIPVPISEVFAPNPISEINCISGEIGSGAVERRFKFPTLPQIIDDQIKAKYTNGLLVIKVPKNLESGKQKAKRKVLIEDVPDETLLFEERGGLK